MNRFVTGIAQLFSSNAHEIEESSAEDFHELTVYYRIDLFDRQLPAILNLEGLNSRDVLAIGLFDGDDENATEQRLFNTGEMNEWEDFIDYYRSIDKDDPIKLKICITKHKVQGKYSVYSPNLFAHFLNQQGFEDFLLLFGQELRESNLCVEYQEGDISLIGSKLAFVKKGHEPVYLAKPLLNDNLIEQGKFLCCNDLICDHLTPADFELQGTDNSVNPLMPLFEKTVILYSLCFLFDYVKINQDDLYYKLNGYKTLAGTIDVEQLCNTDIDINAWTNYLEIFNWQYNGGNTTDKSAIVRNIISLNISEDNKLSLREGTLDAIDSNYRIYERENVKQYIELRNNVSTQLRDYQKDIVGIFDDFEGDFKRLFFSFLTFAFTTAIIRVLAKNIEDNIILPDTIILLLLGFCGASCLYYAYARWERNKKVKLFDKQYNDTRGFYEELLSKKEMNELFTDKRNEDGTYKAFVEERTYLFDWVWIIVNLIIIGILFYIKCVINAEL